jgi:hypothetical protein
VHVARDQPGQQDRDARSASEQQAERSPQASQMAVEYRLVEHGHQQAAVFESAPREDRARAQRTTVPVFLAGSPQSRPRAGLHGALGGLGIRHDDPRGEPELDGLAGESLDGYRLRAGELPCGPRQVTLLEIRALADERLAGVGLGEEDREEHRRDRHAGERNEQLRGERKRPDEHLAIGGVRELLDQRAPQGRQAILHAEEEQGVHGETGGRGGGDDDHDGHPGQVPKAELHASADDQARRGVVRKRQQEGEAREVDERGERLPHEPRGGLATRVRREPVHDRASRATAHDLGEDGARHRVARDDPAEKPPLLRRETQQCRQVDDDDGCRRKAHGGLDAHETAQEDAGSRERRSPHEAPPAAPER